MKKLSLVLGLLAIGCIALTVPVVNGAKEVAVNKTKEVIPQHHQPIEITPYKWKLAWQDDFSSQKIDETKWNVLNRKDSFNNELQYYLPQNVVQSNGELQLIAKKEFLQGKEYTSGLVDTKGKMAFTYGRVEVRAKYSEGKGFFPAVWLLPADGGNHLPEVDVMEAIGSEPEKVYMVYHWDTTGKSKADYSTFQIKNASDYHEYAFEWEPDEMRWYIDGELQYKTKRGIYQKPMNLVMNLAVGGNWEGPPNKDTKFPSAFTIDYVRVYTSNILK